MFYGKEVVSLVWSHTQYGKSFRDHTYSIQKSLIHQPIVFSRNGMIYNIYLQRFLDAHNREQRLCNSESKNSPGLHLITLRAFLKYFTGT